MGEEITPEIIQETQRVLGKYVKKPPLTDKLLRKPPFRFLHDVANVIIKETGFLKGLFTDSELLSDNVKDRDGKVAFLNKLITAVKTISNEDLQVRASKIIAGLEPAETNKLLQTIGVCLDKKLDSKEYVNQLKKAKIKSKDSTKKSTEKTKDAKSKARDASTDKASKTKDKTVDKVSKTDIKVKKVTKTKESPRDKIKREEKAKSKESPKPKQSIKELKASPKQSPREVSIPDVSKTKDSPREQQQKEETEQIAPEPQEIEQTATEPAAIKPETSVERKVLERPKSARPRSGDVRKLQSEPEEIKPAIEVKKEPPPPPPAAINRPRSSLRPPSVRPSSARPGAPRLRPDSSLPMKEMLPLGKIKVIVENYDANSKEMDDEEETVVIQNTIEEPMDSIILEKSLDIPTDKGHLVEQILEQIQKPEELEEHVKGTIDWEQENLRGRDATSKEINQLRSSIQALTKTANPLGKLMSYLHEDIEAMHSELNTWTTLRRQYATEISKQKRLNSESNTPLLRQLQDIEESIAKQREELALVTYSVLRNEEKIRELVGRQVAMVTATR